LNPFKSDKPNPFFNTTNNYSNNNLNSLININQNNNKNTNSNLFKNEENNNNNSNNTNININLTSEAIETELILNPITNNNNTLNTNINNNNQTIQNNPAAIAAYHFIKPRFLYELNGAHTSTVNIIRFSPNGLYLASGGDDSAIVIWVQKSRPIEFGSSIEKVVWCNHKILRGHLSDIYDIAWSPDSKYLISGSVDNRALIWSLEKGKVIDRSIDHLHFVQGVSWDPRNKYVTTQSTDKSAKILCNANIKNDIKFYPNFVIKKYSNSNYAMMIHNLANDIVFEENQNLEGFEGINGNKMDIDFDDGNNKNNSLMNGSNSNNSNLSGNNNLENANNNISNRNRGSVNVNNVSNANNANYSNNVNNIKKDKNNPNNNIHYFSDEIQCNS
jgi:WD40 repeat protein